MIFDAHFPADSQHDGLADHSALGGDRSRERKFDQLRKERRTPVDRNVGLDAHASSSTVAVVGSSGRKLQSQDLETNAKALISLLRTVPKDRHLCPEEGIQLL